MCDIRRVRDVLEHELAKLGKYTWSAGLDGDTVNVRLRTPTRDWLADFSITQFPHNQEIYIFSASCVNATYRGQGWGRKLHQLRLRVMEQLNAKVLLCTVRMNNKPQEHILSNEGWIASNVVESTHPDGDVHGWRMWRKML